MAGEDTHGESPLEEVRVSIAQRLESRRGEIEEAIFARVRYGVSDLAGSDEAEYVEGLRATVAAVLNYGLTGIEQGDQGSATVPPAAVKQARCAARAGVGLDTVLRRYVAGHALLGDFAMQEVYHDDSVRERIALRRVLETLVSLLDRLIPSITSAYMQEIERARKSPAGRNGVQTSDRPKGSSYHIESTGNRDGSTTSRVQVAQRARILEAMVQVVAERGFTGTSVKLLTARAGVSSRTFYERFEGLEDCFMALLDLGLEHAGTLIAEAFAREDRWQDGLRVALASLLVFFESEPLLTQIWFIEAMATGSWALERRERNIALLRSMIVDHWTVPGYEQPEPLTIAGVMSSVLGLIHIHLITKTPGPLIELLGPLMGLVTAPYLDTWDVKREIGRGTQLVRAIQAGDHIWEPPQATQSDTGLRVGHDAALPAMLSKPSARRARECLHFLFEHPDASNREVAVGIGVIHRSQISRLLSHLLGEDLVAKRSQGVGKRNAWRLTLRGEQISRAFSEQRD